MSTPIVDGPVALEVDRRLLASSLRNILPFADADAVSLFRCVVVSWTGTYLTLEATDRYAICRMEMQLMAAAVDVAPWQVLLELSRVRMLRRFLKDGPGHSCWVSFHEDYLSVTNLAQESLQIGLYPPEIPWPVTQIIDETVMEPPVAVDGCGFTSKLLARFSFLRYSWLEFHGPGKPVVVRGNGCMPAVTGLIMALRSPDGDREYSTSSTQPQAKEAPNE